MYNGRENLDEKVNGDIDFDGGAPVCTPSNRGCTKYSPIRVKLQKEVKLSRIKEGYLIPLWQGYDSVQEAFNVSLGGELLGIINKLKEKDDGKGPTCFDYRGQRYQYRGGAKGFAHAFATDDLLFFVRSAAADGSDWGLSVRYLSAGLVEHGYDALRARVDDFIALNCRKRGEDWERLSRIDVAFDFYSPEFTKEMRPTLLDAIICPQKVKQMGNLGGDKLSFFAHAGNLETITIGSIKSLQVQIYDKTKEITEFSQKYYMYDLWGGKYESDVWRVEMRFCKEFLKNRNIRNLREFRKYQPELLREALILRRLAVPDTKDTNRSRWALHPLWSACVNLVGDSLFAVKIGRKTTQKREVMKKNMTKNMAGDLRVVLELLQSDCNDNEMISVFLEEVRELMKNDPKHMQKLQKIKDRFEFLEEAA